MARQSGLSKWLARTKLSCSLAVNCDVCPVIWPVNFLILPKSEDGFDGESHSRLADAWHLALAVMRDPGWRMEMCINTMATPGCHDFATSGLGMLFDHNTEVSYRRTGFD